MATRYRGEDGRVVTAVADAPPFTVTEPGVYEMPEEVYHADPVPGGSLSASGAKKLLACPAKFAYEREQPRPSAAMEFGTAVHTLVLGKGSRIAVVDAENWKTNAAKAAAKEARSEGKIPLLSGDHLKAKAVADAVLAHPVAGKLFNPEFGDAERSIFWVDELTGVWLRSRLDWLPHPAAHGRRLVVGDFKSAASASKAAISKAVANYGYHIQNAFYSEAVRAMGLDEDPGFVFVFAEKEPPYPITLAQLDDDALMAGHAAMRRAIERYRDCTASGIWPAYSETPDVIETISLPRWAQMQAEEDYL
jgi:hypothetical protein